jgi:purine-binding chemotaxis protein CheW
MIHRHDDDASDDPGEARAQVACFCVGDGEYALDIMRIKEIINPVRITAVPRAPAFIEGIIELRGAYLPVIDLRKRFGLEPTPLTREGKYVIVGLEGRIVGLVVDRVIDVRRIDPDQVSEAPQLARGPEARFLSGVFSSDDRIVMMIDLDEVLSPAERSALRGLAQVDL